MAEHLAVEEHRRHRHDLALVHFALEQGAVDHHVLDARVQNRHQVQRLHDIRAVMTRERDVGLESQRLRGVDGANLLDEFGIHLGWMAADLQQAQHEGGELMAERDAGEADPGLFAGASDGERGFAGICAVFPHADKRGERLDLVQQLAQLT